MVTKQRLTETNMVTRLVLPPRQQTCLEIRQLLIEIPMETTSEPRPRPRISLETPQQLIEMRMAISWAEITHLLISMVTQTQVTRMLTDTLQALQPLPLTILEQQRPRIETATATLSAPRLRQRIILELKTRSNEVTPVTHPSGHGDLSLH